MNRSRTTSLLRAALVAALVGAGALITIPVGPVPVTLQVLVVAVAALVLTPAESFGAVALYLLLGTLGVPVFSGGGAGPGALVGPTGGFLFGFLAGAPSAALLRRALSGPRRSGPGLLADAIAILWLIAVTYASGWAWFALVTGRGAAEAFGIAVAPFVVVDVLKAGVALLVARGVRAAGLGDAWTRPAREVC